MHVGTAKTTHKLEVGRYAVYDSIATNKAVFITTNLEKYTSNKNRVKKLPGVKIKF